MSSCNKSHCHLTESLARWANKLAFEMTEIGTSTSGTSTPASPTIAKASSPLSTE
ncbi:hypothetical protein KFK09_008743 [Dendrobium nobile]|uniref:Uncharacterized protein n=1 Tax=Dendrobium nobile TaxID=94219 RepID=A0A8T3BLJ5_DENNO|nr:hypothetical protein KFK09_008743 [Dendrobium nobile]